MIQDEKDQKAFLLIRTAAGKTYLLRLTFIDRLDDEREQEEQ
jgi:hypothetical protein